MEYKGYIIEFDVDYIFEDIFDNVDTNTHMDNYEEEEIDKESIYTLKEGYSVVYMGDSHYTYFQTKYISELITYCDKETTCMTYILVKGEKYKKYLEQFMINYEKNQKIEEDSK